MKSAELLIDGFDRVVQSAKASVSGLNRDQLSYRPVKNANSIAWLIWHLARIQDDHISEVAGHEQAWTSGGFHDRLNLGLPAADTGFGHSSDEVARVVADGEVLIEYLGAVTNLTKQYLSTLAENDYDRIVDERWDPPVSLGVRLVSVLDDDIKHVGQAAYVRGLIPNE